MTRMEQHPGHCVSDRRAPRKSHARCRFHLPIAKLMKAIAMLSPAPLAHHVLFWLKDPASTADRDRLIRGIRSLAAIEQVRTLHIGIPADTASRDVVDASYGVSELLFFDTVQDQDIYQDHPIHRTFVEECSMLWSKVVVYDAMAVEP
jgi:hypothetical protein